MAQRAYQRLCDWTPDVGPQDEWLARWAENGWRVEHGPVQVVIGGTRRVRHAMIHEAQRPASE